MPSKTINGDQKRGFHHTVRQLGQSANKSFTLLLPRQPISGEFAIMINDGGTSKFNMFGMYRNQSSTDCLHRSMMDNQQA